MNSLLDNVVSILVPVGAWMFTYMIHSTFLFLLVLYLVKLPLFKQNRVKEYLWKFALIGGVFTASIQSFSGINKINSSLIVYTIPFNKAFFDKSEQVPAPRVAVLNKSNKILDKAETYSNLDTKKETIALDTRAFTFDLALVLAVLVGIWVLVSTFLLIRKQYQSRKFVAQLNPLSLVKSTSLLSLAKTLQMGTQIRDLKLYFTRQHCSPMAINYNIIILPERVESLPIESQKALIAHEYAHLLRHDPVWLTIYNLFSCFFFIQPLTKRIIHELQVLAELLCDDWAAEQIKNPKAMAMCLVEVASWVQFSRNREYAYAMASMPSALQLRVESILKQEKKLKHKLGYSLCVSALIFNLVLFVIPGIDFQTPTLPVTSEAISEQMPIAADHTTKLANKVHATTTSVSKVSTEDSSRNVLKKKIGIENAIKANQAVRVNDKNDITIEELEASINSNTTNKLHQSGLSFQRNRSSFASKALQSQAITEQMQQESLQITEQLKKEALQQQATAEQMQQETVLQLVSSQNHLQEVGH